MESLPKGSSSVLEDVPPKRMNGKVNSGNELKERDEICVNEDSTDKASLVEENFDLELLDFPENLNILGFSNSPATEEQNLKDDFFDKLMSG